MVDGFSGDKIISEVGTIQRENIKITSFASAHIDTDAIVTENATNYMFLIEVDDFSMIHAGALGQIPLTQEQKAAVESACLS